MSIISASTVACSDVAAVEITELVVDYGRKRAVNGLTLSAERREVLVILGPNGAGKTTTVETAEGYIRPTSGKVRVLGLDPMTDKRELLARIGVMLQKGGIYPAMNPRQVLRLFASYYSDAYSPEAVLELVGLKEVSKTPFKRLSGGEQQRLGLGLALIGRPEVVFLDEPTAGVDPAGRLAIRELVANLKESGTCVVITTHELAEAERMADRIALIDSGRLLALGSPSELSALGASSQRPPVRFRTIPALSPAELEGLLRDLGCRVFQDHGGEYSAVLSEDGPSATARLVSWLASHKHTLIDLRTAESLEETYLRLTSKGSLDAGLNTRTQRASDQLSDGENQAPAQHPPAQDNLASEEAGEPKQGPRR